MIGKLRGTIDSIGEDFLILDVNGVGYVVHGSTRTLQSLPQAGAGATLAIETQVREDSIRLYGFLSEGERDWFRLLQTVQGVGAKVALALLGMLSADELGLAIARQDKSALARTPGVGPRLAARLVAELKDKAPASFGVPSLAGATAAALGAAETPAIEDAIAALINLDYSRQQATNAIAAARAELGENAEAAALIRRGLRELSR
ncbi:Holliday junction branch migration protein RuvA [uncultured Methylovirgula sp.]|uniref:Holliday junction branch migration protein RuvA n=1 Tax=uncultured Methylovirgula sp. TaxID=1285960 RepID=UPI002608EC83|nr:Holliday junction branch migration protein RuvA [uncultured Methylovirgula sp.]